MSLPKRSFAAWNKVSWRSGPRHFHIEILEHNFFPKIFRCTSLFLISNPIWNKNSCIYKKLNSEINLNEIFFLKKTVEKSEYLRDFFFFKDFFFFENFDMTSFGSNVIPSISKEVLHHSYARCGRFSTTLVQEQKSQKSPITLTATWDWKIFRGPQKLMVAIKKSEIMRNVIL